MSLSSTTLPGSPIQRLVIFHLNFAEICTDIPLGEGASLDELGEQILYYHRYDRSTSSPFAEGGIASYRNSQGDTEEAVQFVGLCTALHGLPTAMDGWADLKDDRTKEVHFEDSSLVFVPLESSERLLAVAQISRLYIRGIKCEGGGGNPLAVRQSIQRCHKLFCLLRGGGIITRLSLNFEPRENSLQGDTTEKSETYPGMKELFRLRKDYRHNRDKVSRLSETHHLELDELDNKAKSLCGDIVTLLQALPIQSLRKELEVHYAEYLGELSVVTSRCGCAARCLIEAVPAPVAIPSGLHISHCAPAALCAQSSVQRGLAIRQILEEQHTYHDNRPLILGISTFIQGQLLYTHLSKKIPELSVDENYCLPNEVALLVMGHMASYRCKMNHRVPLRGTPSSHPPAQHRLSGLKKFAFFASSTDEALAGDENDVFHQGQEQTTGNFLMPPPLFMMSASDRTHCFHGPNDLKIWAPKIHLPLHPVGNEEAPSAVDVHAILFEATNFDFVIYIHAKMRDPLWEAEERVGLVCDSNSDIMVGGYPAPLTESNKFSFFEELGQQLVLLSNEVEGGSPKPDVMSRSELLVEKWEQPGQHIVFVDRSRHRLVLFSGQSPQLSNKGRDVQRPNGKSSLRRFLGFPSGKGAHGEKVPPTDSIRYSDSEWSALGCDCRHRLASHLPLDIVLAFDDMMNEVSNVRAGAEIVKSRKDYFHAKVNAIQDGCLELCTCMSQGWVYAYSDKRRELYAYFDNSIYVTVTDVQNAALAIRMRMFGL